MRDLGCEELEESLQLVGVAPERWRELHRVGVLRELDRPHVELKVVAKALDATEHPYGVALREPSVEQVDVLPDTALDPPALVHELECKVIRPGSRT